MSKVTKWEKTRKKKEDKMAGVAKRGRKPKSERTEKPRRTSKRVKEKTEEKKKSFHVLPLIMAGIIAALAGTLGKIGLGGGSDGFGILPIGFGNITVVSESDGDDSESETLEASTSVEMQSEKEQGEDEIRYVEVTVNEDGYLYQNSKQKLEDIFDDISEGDVIRLKIHRASKNDVDNLIDAASERGIKIIYE